MTTDRKAGHTKGPWTLLVARTMAHIKGRFGELIVSLPWRTERDKANAHLIAAAPDLLAELERLYELYGHEKTRQAIARAQPKP